MNSTQYALPTHNSAKKQSPMLQCNVSYENNTSDPPSHLRDPSSIEHSQIHSRSAEVYCGFSWSKYCMATNNRADAVLLARLRADHTPLLKAYANRLDPSADPLCPLCKQEPQTIEHWLRRCPSALSCITLNESKEFENSLYQ